MIVESRPAPDLVIAEVQRRACTRQQGAKTFFPLRNRHRANRFAIEVEEIEQEEDERAAVSVSDAFWIRLNEVVPSGLTPQSSPSR